MADLSKDLFGPSESKNSAAPITSAGKDLSGDLFGSGGTGSSSEPDKVSSLSLSDLVTGKKPVETTALGTAARSFGETAITVPGAMLGAGQGMRVGAAIAPFTGPLAPAMPFVGGVAGGLLYSVAQSFGINSLEQFADTVFGTNIMGTKQAQAKEHPIAEKVGAFGGMVLGPGGALTIPKLTTKQGLQHAGIGAGTMLGIGGTQRALEGGHVFDPKDMVFDAATGLFAGPSKLGEKLIAKGRGVPYVDRSKTPGDKPIKPPEGATPEQIAEWLKETKERNARLDAESPLVQAALRNKETGEIERHGPKHDEARKADTTAPKTLEGWSKYLQKTDLSVEQRNEATLSYLEAFVEQKRKDSPDKFIEDSYFGDPSKGQSDTDRGVARYVEKYKNELPESVQRSLYEQTVKDLETGEILNALTDSVRGGHIGQLRRAVGDRIEQRGSAVDTHEQGFVDERGNFLDRKEAWNRAVNTEQIPKDHVPENIADGLHSGDLRKAGDERFQITEEQPAGVPNKQLLKMYEEGKAHDEGIANSKNVSGLIKHLVGKYGEDHYISQVLTALGKHLDTDLPVNILTKDAMRLFNIEHGLGENSPGAYTENVGVFLQEGRGTNSIVAGHEIVHAILFSKVEALKSMDPAHPEYAKGQKLLKDVYDIMESVNKSVDRATLTPEQNKALDYALKDPHEFLSDGIFNPGIMKHLMAIEEKRPGGFLPQIVKAIGEFFGLKPNEYTALHKLLGTAQKIAKTELPSSQKSSSKMEKDAETKSVSTPKSLASIAPEESAKLAETTAPEVAKAAEKVDVRTIPNKEAFLDHATEIYHKYGEEETIKFFDDYAKHLNERAIPVPNNQKGMDDALHKVNTWETADTSEHVTGYKENTKAGVTDKQREEWFNMRERGEELPPEAKAILDPIDSENQALVRKAKNMGLDVGDEFATGQSRIRISGGVTSNWKNMITELFANRTPMGDKVAETANAAYERKVYQLDDGRVVELHRQPENVEVPYTDATGKKTTKKIYKGTEIWEWKGGRKSKIGHSPDLELKRGGEITFEDGSKATLVDGKVPDIEAHSPYRYLHDAEASARLANMGLRKMVREAELMQNLMKSDYFKQVGHSPDEPLKTLPKGWRVPDNIDRIPQLRGWHFDPKTAAIIEDFAKVWDNTMWMKLSNQIVKNLMLNPVPHMFNEVMHLWNARGFSGWVPGTGRLSVFKDTARAAWRDVGQQTQFYRDIMREGGSILGADPRNNLFDKLVIETGKQVFKDANVGVGGLAKKLGTTAGDLYNGISRKSQQAMWFTRDVMYVQLIREAMKREPNLTLKAAIEKVERHMPNYRLPSEVAGSRGVSKVLRNPNISMFSRYHYGMVKSLVNTIKDINPTNLKSPEGRKHFREGVDSMLAIGVAMAVLYPLMDKMAEAMFGEGAEQRRAGPFHLIHAAEEVALSKRDASALIWPVFTFNPMLLTLGQLALNKKVFSGKQIYHPEDKMGDIASDIGSYAVKQIPQSPMAGIVNDKEGEGMSYLAKQMDIKAKTPAQREKERTARKREEASRKSRETKRKKGTYNP